VSQTAAEAAVTQGSALYAERLARVMDAVALRTSDRVSTVAETMRVANHAKRSRSSWDSRR